jgi:hypothetical protein
MPELTCCWFGIFHFIQNQKPNQDEKYYKVNHNHELSNHGVMRNKLMGIRATAISGGNIDRK